MIDMGEKRGVKMSLFQGASTILEVIVGLSIHKAVQGKK